MFTLIKSLFKGIFKLFGKALLFITVLAVIAGVYFDRAEMFSNAQTPKDTAKSAKAGKMYGPYKVKRVVDGDTFIAKIDGEDIRIRLIGVDTPESVSQDEQKNTAWGKKASKYTKSILKGKKVYLKYDKQKKDIFDRTLAYVYYKPKNSKKYVMLNKVLVKNGYARAVYYAPNGKYRKTFDKLQKEAIKKKRGFWKDGFNKAFPDKTFPDR